jgi:hypothetical protein
MGGSRRLWVEYMTNEFDRRVSKGLADKAWVFIDSKVSVIREMRIAALGRSHGSGWRLRTKRLSDRVEVDAPSNQK